METAILILKSSLLEQKQQLSRAEKERNNYKNDKQKAFREKIIENLKGFIADIEKAIEVLERAMAQTSNDASALPIPDVSERTWTVNEIIEQLQAFQNANSAAAWFHMYGR